jgi:hypothetical protein
MNYPDRYPTWVHEQAPGYRRPTATGALVRVAILAMIVLALLGGPQAYAEHVDRVNAGKPATLCEEHKGRPGWDAICRETARR